ncbi:alpha/beta hydrolase, partial [Burkholderia oklahomensis]|uniref:alpha/beta hydrolase n=1 Tax=Burkholderia oklahomensis TaxID=342113 RepID=UPI0018E0B1C7
MDAAASTPPRSAATADTGVAPRRERLRTGDGLELASYRWPAPASFAAPRATVALVHGLAEHAGRYQALAERLTAAGIEVVAADLP